MSFLRHFTFTIRLNAKKSRETERTLTSAVEQETEKT